MINRATRWGLLALVALTVIAHAAALRGGFIWDDDDHLTDNPAVAAADGPRQIWSSLFVSRYYPLTLTTFWAERHCWGLTPWPYHAVNIALHAASAALLWQVLRRLNVRAAWLAAALWAVHPVQVESVAWITEMKNTQSGLFFFLALLCFLRFEERPRPGWYAAALTSFAAALLSKPSTVTLPLVLLLCAWWQRQRWTRTDLLRAAPFFGMSLGMSLLTITEQQLHVHGALSQDWSLGWAERLIVAGHAVWFYAAKLLWPANLMFVYPRWEIDPRAPAAWLPLVALLAVAAMLWRWRSRAWARAGLFALAAFAAVLAPVLGFFNIYYFRFSFVADHFNYLASAAVLALAAAALDAIRPRGAERALSRPRSVAVRRTPAGSDFAWTREICGVAVCGGVLAGLALSSWAHTAVFRSNERLWLDTVARNPGAGLAHNNLGNILKARHQYDQAIEHWRLAAQLGPDSWSPEMNLGKLSFEQDRLDDALAHFQAALRLRPASFEAHCGLGMTLTAMGNYQAALAQLEAARSDRPENGLLHFWLGTVHDRRGDFDQAALEYQLAIRYAPDLVPTYLSLGTLRLKQGNPERAIQCFRTAATLQPNEPLIHQTLAAAYADQHRFDEAIAAARRARDLANAQHNTPLAEELRAQLERYQAAQPAAPHSTGSPAPPAAESPLPGKKN